MSQLDEEPVVSQQFARYASQKRFTTHRDAGYWAMQRDTSRSSTGTDTASSVVVKR